MTREEERLAKALDGGVTLEKFARYVYDTVLSVQAISFGESKLPEKVSNSLNTMQSLANLILQDDAMEKESSDPDRFDLSSLKVDLSRELPEGG